MKTANLAVLMLLFTPCGCFWNEDDEGEDQLHVASLRDSQFLQDDEHFQSHYEDLQFVLEKGDVEAEEKEFHFFKAHDSNSDNRLDGIELMDALKHGAQRHLDRALAKHLTPAERKARVEKVFERLSNKVDQILEEDDRNDDGYISYFEYASARRTAETLHDEADADG